MRRARKEGRYLTTGPYGYVNRTTDSGRKMIVPAQPQAGLIRWAFDEIPKGQLCIDDVRKEMNKRRFMCSKSNLYSLIKNPIYCGKLLCRNTERRTQAPGSGAARRHCIRSFILWLKKSIVALSVSCSALFLRPALQKYTVWLSRSLRLYTPFQD
jgi:hypothetical protein